MGDRKRVAIADDVATTVDVDLWGTAYILQPASRSVLKKAAPIEEELEKVTDHDELVAIYGKLLDLRLKAVNGGGKASTHIRQKWNADELTIDQINSFVDRLGDADRPS